MPAQLRSVSEARAELTRVASGWGCPGDVVDDARVVLSELMSNGVLHARTELRVVVAHHPDGGLRLEVHDASAVPVQPPLESVTPRATLLDNPMAGALVGDDLSPPTATGRGLAMVSALADSWGWFPEAGGGKTVWAEVGLDGAAGADAGRARPGPTLHMARPVRVVAAPLRLLKESEDHFDDLFRELQMAALASSPAHPGSEFLLDRVVPVAEVVRSRLARLREPVRRSIWEAVRRGDRLVDLNLVADAGTPEVFELSDQLLESAAKAVRRGLLLTEPPGREVVAWRRWLRREIEDQIAGRPPTACPFPVVPAARQAAGVRRRRLDAARRAAVEELRAELSGAGYRGRAKDGEQVLRRALDRLIGYLGAERAVVMTLAEDNETMKFGPSVGFSPVVTAYWQSYSVSADLPACEAVRTGEPQLFRTFAELDDRYPIFLSTPSESDPAIACLPLAATGQAATFGCLSLGFSQARDFGSQEVAFLLELADVVAGYVSAGRRRHRQREVSQRRQAVQHRARVIAAAATRAEVLDELVRTMVELLADSAAVHLVQHDGTIRYVTTRHRDPEREATTRAVLERQRPSLEGSDMVSECARSCRPRVLQVLSEEAITAGASDDEESRLVRKLGIGSVAVVPVQARGALVGVVSIAKDVGRFISDDDLQALQLLADQAGEALARLGSEIS
jgi:GAF domain-containing protein/anti-sigma regulatory factor (Ser/Thr protein kinase)